MDTKAANEKLIANINNVLGINRKSRTNVSKEILAHLRTIMNQYRVGFDNSIASGALPTLPQCAGLFEGDGCVGLYEDKPGLFGFRFEIGSCDKNAMNGFLAVMNINGISMGMSQTNPSERNSYVNKFFKLYVVSGKNKSFKWHGECVDDAMTILESAPGVTMVHKGSQFHLMHKAIKFFTSRGGNKMLNRAERDILRTYGTYLSAIKINPYPEENPFNAPKIRYHWGY